MTPDGSPPIASLPRRFDDFVLDPADRRLSRDGVTVELSGRYLDALILLTDQPGRLISKDRFMAEVGKGVPVTDEALTQCIRSLRKALGDALKQLSALSIDELLDARFKRLMAYGRTQEQPAS